MKTTRSIRFDPDKLARAEKLGLDVSEICRDSLDLELHLQSKLFLSDGKTRENFIINFYAIKRLKMGRPRK